MFYEEDKKNNIKGSPDRSKKGQVNKNFVKG